VWKTVLIHGVILAVAAAPLQWNETQRFCDPTSIIPRV
jgi:hypothetical protein